MKIGDIVAVSLSSKSASRGCVAKIVGFNFSRGQVIVSISGVSAANYYVKERHIIELEAPAVEEVESHDGYVCESNDIRGVVAQDVETIDQSHVGVDFKWKIGQGIQFDTPVEFEYFINGIGRAQTSRSMGGYITDQWVEEGVKLYNVVFKGTFKVIPESFITCECGVRLA